MSQIGEALIEAADPPIRAIYVWQLEPAGGGTRQQPGARRFHARRSLLRGYEQFQTDTADYADILLPATTQLEHHDVQRGLWPPQRGR